jgi:hypothetical protein
VSRRVAAAAVLTIALTATGCGIAPDRSARAIEPPPGPYQLTTPPPPTPASTGPVTEQLFLVKDGKLVRVERKISGAQSVQQLMNDLLAGATSDEQRVGLSSALPGNNVIGGVTVNDGVATVDLGPGLEDTGRNDEVLALGQVVCTLDGRSDVKGVLFRQDGQTIAVPRADGALSTGPLTAADYTDLLTQ